MQSDMHLGDSVAATLEKSEWGRQGWDAGPRGRERSCDRGRAHTVRGADSDPSQQTPSTGKGPAITGAGGVGAFRGAGAPGLRVGTWRWHSSAAAVQRKGRAFQRSFLVFNVSACVLLGVLLVGA